jgi:nucleotide-binding universal stress UspA family protein
MFKRIVLGFDGSEQSQDALALTADLVAGTAAPVTVVSSFPFSGVPPAERSRVLAEESEAFLDTARRNFEGVEVTGRPVSDDSPARALNDASEEIDADLIVIGSTHRGTLGRVFPGSVGDRLLSGAPCAVAIAPLGYASSQHADVGLIGVAYVDEPEAHQALSAAAELAAARGATLRLISVIDLRPRNFVMPDLIREVAGDIEDDLKAADEALGAEVDHEATVLEGDPAAELAAQGVELDLLVLGSRGYGPVGRTLLGGVSSEVIRTAPCPVIVFPRSAG